jgi:UDP-N-acetyl-D-glucosamine dehydrogenase
MDSYNSIISKIDRKEVVVGIFGLGYVGLPLAVSFAKSGIKVIGFEQNEKKIKSLNNKINYISDIPDEDFQLSLKNSLEATSDASRIKECDAAIICVPTPLDIFKKPNMSYIETVSINIAKNMKKGTFISLESTTYPTTTEDFIKPIIEKYSGKKEGIDFWLCFSPERVDPGNKTYNTANIPKIIGGLGKEAGEIAMKLYSLAVGKLHLVSSPRTAEMVKILENTYRLVNISLINELALLSNKLDINIWEVIDAAKTKPFGFQAFYPGPGIGGHCIPLDPFYLEHIAKKYDFDTTLITTAGHVNNLMPHRMSIKINFALNRHKKAINGSKILFLGVAYKNDIDDESESPALKMIDEVAKKFGLIMYHDPYISDIITPAGRRFHSVDLTNDLLESVDCVVFTTNHSCFDVQNIVNKAKLIVDLRNAVNIQSDKVFRL